MILIAYSLKVQVVFTVLFIVYYGFFRKEKFLVLNRFILISVIAISFVLPVAPTFNISALRISHPENSNTVINRFYKFSGAEQLSQNVIHTTNAEQGVNYGILSLVTYLIVAASLLIILLINLYKIYSVIRVSRRSKVNGLIYCEPLDQTPAFSFFNYIVIAANSLSPEEYQQVIVHESAHSKQWHTFDVLLADVACILLWINPLVYLYRRQIKLNLEFLADEAALNSGLDARAYQLTLLQHSGLLPAYQPVNAFFTSKIKERVVMMNTTKPNMGNSYKYILLLPVALVLSVLVGFQKGSPAVVSKMGLLNNVNLITDMPVEVKQVDPIKKNRPDRQPSIKLATVLPAIAQQQTTPDGTNIYIDARTDTVKFTLVSDTTSGGFKGIYVINDKVLTGDELKAQIGPTGRMEMLMANRPIIGAYSANDMAAINKWGEQARPGVVFIKARPENPDK